MKVQVVTVDGMQEVFQGITIAQREGLLEELESERATIIIKDSTHKIWFPKQQIIRVRISDA